MNNFNNCVKVIDREYFENIWQYGFVLLYTYLYDRALNKNKRFLINRFIDAIKYEFDFLNNMNFEKNLYINSVQNILPENLWLLTFKKIYLESCKFDIKNSITFSLRNLDINKEDDSICIKNFFILLDRLNFIDIEKMSVFLSNELIKISNCFELIPETKLFRIVVLKKSVNHFFETILTRFLSCSISFGTCFFTFGINKVMDLVSKNEAGSKNEYQIIIYEILTKKEIKVIPTSICCLQEEEEIVLMPGTLLKILCDLKEIDINYVYSLLQNEVQSEYSWQYVENFFKYYSYQIKFLLYKLEI